MEKYSIIIVMVLGMLLGGCSASDPVAPGYSSQGKEKMPKMSIESATYVLVREASLRVRFEGGDKRPPRKLYLCYAANNDKPEITDQKIDLSPDYAEGLVDVVLNNLEPFTLYYCRLYVETSDSYAYSGSFKFQTFASDNDMAWEKVADFPDLKSIYLASCVVGEDIFVFQNPLDGGIMQEGTTLLRFSTTTNSWEKEADFPGGPRCRPTMCAIDGKIYMGLGYILDAENRGIGQNDFWEYDPFTKTWRKMNDMPDCYTAIMASFVTGGKWYLVSNEGMWENVPMHVIVFDPKKNRWERLANFPGKKVSRALALSVGDRVFVVGGSFPYGAKPAYSKILWEYEVHTDTWFRRTDFPGSARNEMLGFVVNGRLYAGYGVEMLNDPYITYANDLWEYLPERDIWASRSTFTSWWPQTPTMSAGVGNAGYLGDVQHGVWKYLPIKDR